MHNFENQTAHQITNGSSPSRVLGRRAFLGRMAAGAALLAAGAAFMAAGKAKGRPNLDKGDAALLRFAAAAEILEADFWVQYIDVAGIEESEEPVGTVNHDHIDGV